MVRKNNAYGNSSLNDFHLPLPKPKCYKPKRPIDSNWKSVNISGESVLCKLIEYVGLVVRLNEFDCMKYFKWFE